MTEKPEFNEGWAPALEGEEWKAYKEKQFQHLTHHQKFLAIYRSLNRSDLSPELKSLIDAANKTIETGNELLGHMSFVRGEREKEKKKSTQGIRKGGQFAPWKPHEQIILTSLVEYDSDENRIKYKSDSSKITQSTARYKIEQKTGLSVTESTFNTWLKRYRVNNGRVFS
jgi:hypothetical protein